MNGLFFDEVGEACDLQAVRPDPETAVDGTPLIVGFGTDAVGTGLVLVGSFEHGRIDLDLALDVHVPKATWAVDELV